MQGQSSSVTFQLWVKFNQV